ncbi:MAG: DUF4153 domain-containing protein [Aquaticitalea sp.]
MKTFTTIIASLLFSTLFYDQNIGLNLLLFSILTVVVLGLSNRDKIRNKSILLQLGLYLMTAVLVFFNHSELSIFANCIAFFTLVGSFSESDSSIYVKWLNGLYTSIAGIFHRNFEASTKDAQLEEKQQIDALHTAKLIVIPLVVIVLFVLLYKNGNPFFNNIISKINFDFINIQWILFCVLGYYLFSNIIIPVQVEPATNVDLKTRNDLKQSEPLLVENLKKEKQLGTILMVLLNVLIVFYIISDIAYLTSNDNFAASVLSEQVHSGINALIASIIFAIIIILYFFRGNLNFFEGNKTLKSLSYTWIFLNAFLVILIVVKNNQYVDLFGLTYKRIGVYMYLMMTMVGLLTTFLKVFNIQNLWFLFRKNVQVAFALLIISSFVDWDYQITDYNLKHAESIDINYLIDLSDNNAFLLQERKDNTAMTSNQYNRIQNKYDNYVEELTNNTWQEWTYDQFKVTQKRTAHEPTK